MTRAFILATALLTVAGCANVGGTVATVSTDIAVACSVASQAAGIAKGTVKGGAAKTADNIAVYVDSVCATAEAMAAVASNPGTVAWLNQLAGGLGALTAAQNAPG